jgi:hypothetical protein
LEASLFLLLSFEIFFFIHQLAVATSPFSTVALAVVEVLFCPCCWRAENPSGTVLPSQVLLKVKLMTMCLILFLIYKYVKQDSESFRKIFVDKIKKTTFRIIAFPCGILSNMLPPTCSTPAYIYKTSSIYYVCPRKNAILGTLLVNVSKI